MASMANTVRQKNVGNVSNDPIAGLSEILGTSHSV